jgi:hypothetical protein
MEMGPRAFVMSMRAGSPEDTLRLAPAAHPLMR